MLPRSKAHVHNALAEEGCAPTIVSEVLKNSSVSITLGVYSHVIPGLGTATVEMEDAFGD